MHNSKESTEITESNLAGVTVGKVRQGMDP